jgi:hypothetical protein
MSVLSPDPWLSRRRRVTLSALFLAYLLYVGIAVVDHSWGMAEATGLVILGLFALAYIGIVDRAGPNSSTTRSAASSPASSSSTPHSRPRPSRTASHRSPPANATCCSPPGPA